jgi:glycosyltransferase involved in cell wall biosynthesis
MKLISVDLSAPLPSVPACVSGEQRVLVCLHREPLGFVTTPPAGVSPSDLADMIVREHRSAILRHLCADSLAAETEPLDLERIPPECPQRREPATRVTVAVCTRNRADQLEQCLTSIDALDYPAHLLDVLVVDNAPVDDSTRIVVSRHAGVRYAVEHAPGLDRARNRALQEARGDVIAYTDDDVIVEASWARAVALAFEDEPHAMCVTGLVVPDALDTEAELLFERYGGFGRGFTRKVFAVPAGGSAVQAYGGTGRFGTGANMAFRRAFLLETGGFDPALDVGTPTNGGGDLEMFLRVLADGHALVYEPSAVVRHRHRRDYASLRKQFSNNGFGFYAYLARTARERPRDRAAVIRLGVWWFWWWNVRRLIRTLLRIDAFPVDLVVAELRGSLIGPRRYEAAAGQLASGEAR